MPGFDAQRVFLALAATFGLAFACATPPLQAPDEATHLIRAYAISEGQLLPTQRGDVAGVSVPRSLARLKQQLGGNEISFRPKAKQDLQLLRDAFRLSPDPDEREFVPFNSFYSPLVYLPGAIAVGLARLFGVAPVAYVYPARLLYLLCYCALVWYALGRAPGQRWTLAAVALVPIAVFEAAAVSADGLNLAAAIAALAELLRLWDRRRGPLRPRDLVPLAAWGTLLGLCKPVYIPLVGVAACLPAARFASPRARLGALGMLAASVLPFALWVLALSSYTFAPLREGADPGGQLAHLIEQPQDFVNAVLVSLRHASWLWIETFVGVLGYLDTWLPKALYVGVPLLLLAIAVLDGGPGSPVVGRVRLLFVAAWLALCGLVVVSAYIGWNEIGHPVVWGVQGRYFLPAAPLLLCALQWPRPPRWAGRLGPAYAAAFAATLAVSVFRVVDRYYLD